MKNKETIQIIDESLTDEQRSLRLKIVQDEFYSSGLFTNVNHRHRLTPDRLVLNRTAYNQFSEIGELILSQFKSLERIYSSARGNEFPGDINRYLLRALDAGVRKPDRKISGQRLGDLPAFFRADCILAEEGDGNLGLKLTEIEGERSIGFGFASLDYRVNRAINELEGSNRVGGIGIEGGIALALGDKLPDRLLVIIIGEDQQFYYPEQSLLANGLRSQGMKVTLLTESKVEVSKGSDVKLICPDGEEVDSAVCLPIFNPEKSGKHTELELLRSGYINGSFDFALPPKKIFGTKTSLALLRQPFIRELFISEGVDPSLIESYIPNTRIIAGQISEVERLTLEMGLQTTPPTLLKAVGMSAGRGMAMPDDPEAIAHILSKVAPKSPFEYITQDFLEGTQVNFSVYEDESGEMKTRSQHMRLAACFANIGGKAILMGVAGTGLSQSFVHGSPECIQFPVVFKDRND